MDEDLNRKHTVTLTEGQISTILYCMEGYIQGSDDYSEESEFGIYCNTIFEVLEGTVDNYYDVESCIIRAEDYADCVDKLVESMEEN